MVARMSGVRFGCGVSARDAQGGQIPNSPLSRDGTRPVNPASDPAVHIAPAVPLRVSLGVPPGQRRVGAHFVVEVDPRADEASELCAVTELMHIAALYFNDGDSHSMNMCKKPSSIENATPAPAPGERPRWWTESLSVFRISRVVRDQRLARGPDATQGQHRVGQPAEEGHAG